MSAAVSSGPLRVPLLSPLLYTGRDNDEEIIVHLRDKKLIQSFKVQKNAELGEVFGAFAIKCGISLESLRFMHDGVRLVSTSIPNNCSLKDNDHIDVLTEQKGGFDVVIAPSLFAVSLCC